MPRVLDFPAPKSKTRRRRTPVLPPPARWEEMVSTARSTNPEHVVLIGFDQPRHAREAEASPLIKLEMPRELVDEGVLEFLHALLVRAGVAGTAAPVLTVVH
jgi:hypothetical protein